jgi:hypothetical protein
MVMYKAADTLKPSATSCVVDVGSRPIAEVPCYRDLKPYTSSIAPTCYSVTTVVIASQPFCPQGRRADYVVRSRPRPIS